MGTLVPSSVNAQKCLILIFPSVEYRHQQQRHHGSQSVDAEHPVIAGMRNLIRIWIDRHGDLCFAICELNGNLMFTCLQVLRYSLEITAFRLPLSAFTYSSGISSPSIRIPTNSSNNYTLGLFFLWFNTYTVRLYFFFSTASTK